VLLFCKGHLSLSPIEVIQTFYRRLRRVVVAHTIICRRGTGQVDWANDRSGLFSEWYVVVVVAVAPSTRKKFTVPTMLLLQLLVGMPDPQEMPTGLAEAPELDQNKCQWQSQPCFPSSAAPVNDVRSEEEPPPKKKRPVTKTPATTTTTTMMRT
jgi:hypothetical protein